MTVIMYNTLIGVAAGTALILVPRYWAAVRGEHPPWRFVRDPVDDSGWAAAFGVLGLLLTGLGFMMTVPPARPGQAVHRHDLR
jgi:hypothetical protein